MRAARRCPQSGTREPSSTRDVAPSDQIARSAARLQDRHAIVAVLPVGRALKNPERLIEPKQQLNAAAVPQRWIGDSKTPRPADGRTRRSRAARSKIVPADPDRRWCGSGREEAARNNPIFLADARERRLNRVPAIATPTGLSQSAGRRPRRRRISAAVSGCFGHRFPHHECDRNSSRRNANNG